ncbi:MAG: hypothetical protein ABI663_08880 [Chryseolinea sp.]
MRTLLTFYKNFSLISISITFLSCFLILLSGSPYFIVPAFWIKVFSNAGLLTYIHIFRYYQFNFFFNLGHSIRQLYIKTLAIDFVLWFILAFITLQFL